jgi:hypothetical protein
MARYRKGDRYLSEEEFRDEEDAQWFGILFLITAVTSGYFTYKGLGTFDIPKWLRFIAIIFSSVIAGLIVGRLQKQIRTLLSYLITIVILYLIGSWVWNML